MAHISWPPAKSALSAFGDVVREGWWTRPMATSPVVRLGCRSHPPLPSRRAEEDTAALGRAHRPGHRHHPAMDQLILPRALASAERVLVAGAGGGYDVYAGLPLYLALRRAGKQAFLANLTFTYLAGTR